MKVKTEKKCRNCNKPFKIYSTTDNCCSKKCYTELQKKKREKASERINIQIQGLSKEEAREEIKEKLREFMPNYLENKKVIIKVWRWKVKTDKQKLKKQLDEIFSKFIRLRDWKCVICNTTQNLNNWHFYTRSCLALRFDEINCNTQCATHNKLHEQNTKPYTDWMIKNYWQDKVNELYKIYQWPPLKLTTEWYNEKITYYKEQIKNLENKYEW